MERLAVEKLKKSFGRVRALDGVSFGLGEGELFTLLGPSGSGKTTTLRLIAGFDRPDAGEIRIEGRSVLALPPERRRIGFVFQNYALFPHMTVARNIAYGIRFHRGINLNKRVEELLSLVHLEALAHRRPGELSGGEKQRVALARALAPFPRILLLDEPLSALDAKLREELRGELRRIQRQLSIPTVYVTHDQAEGLAISDRIAVMNQGKIEQIGSPVEVYTHPHTLFVATFIGRSNRFSGTIVEQRADKVTVDVGGNVLLAGSLVGRVPVGMRAALIVRDEALCLGKAEENHIRGEVQEIEYHGEESVFLLLTPIGPLRVRVHNPPLNARVGEPVDVWFPAERGMIFPVDSGSG